MLFLNDGGSGVVFCGGENVFLCVRLLIMCGILMGGLYV